MRELYISLCSSEFFNFSPWRLVQLLILVYGHVEEFIQYCILVYGIGCTDVVDAGYDVFFFVRSFFLSVVSELRKINALLVFVYKLFSSRYLPWRRMKLRYLLYLVCYCLYIGKYSFHQRKSTENLCSRAG